MGVKIKLHNILFLDIETVSGEASYEDLSPRMQKVWRIKSASILKRYGEKISDEDAAELYPERAGIFAEFGKIVCISVGFTVPQEDGTIGVRLKSYASDDEKKLLTEFGQLIGKHYNNRATHGMCGHNLKEFDIPYICRRMMILQMKLPAALDISGSKPWETSHLLDTMLMWRFGDYKNYTSLNLLTSVFDVPTPKDDIDGSEVGRVYWEEKDLKRIAVYCEKDVLAVIQLMLRYERMPLVADEHIKSVSNWDEIPGPEEKGVVN